MLLSSIACHLLNMPACFEHEKPNLGLYYFATSQHKTFDPVMPLTCSKIPSVGSFIRENYSIRKVVTSLRYLATSRPSFSLIKQATLHHFRKLRKLRQKNGLRCDKNIGLKANVRLEYPPVASAIRYGSRGSVKGHKGWWRRPSDFRYATIVSCGRHSRHHFGRYTSSPRSIAPRPSLRHYVPCPPTVRQTVCGCLYMQHSCTGLRP